MVNRLTFSPITEEQWRAAHESMGSVYFILDAEADHIKIGHSRDPWKRLKQLQTGSAGKLTLVGVIAGAPSIEKRMHFEHRDANVHREWFSHGAAAVRWLNTQTNNMPICRFLARLVPAKAFDVFWEWNQEHQIHLKHVFDPNADRWIGPLMHSGKPNARNGWSSYATEISPV
jgi:Meiotically Up-regulated Gene 113 (MUG113) protein